MQWHAMSEKEVLEKLKSSSEGLSKDEFKKRFHIYGPNKISKGKKTPEILKFLKQFNSPLIYILVIAMIISFFAQHKIDAYVILAVIIINAAIGYTQERKAQRAINALEKLIVSYAKVIRSGELIKVPSTHLVPGDIILLEDGDKIPADARIIESHNLRTQESSLTGESLPNEKSSKIIHKSVSLADRSNILYMSTLIVSGTAKAVVVETANKTEIGSVAKSIQEVVQPKMHFNEKVSQLTFVMGLFAIIGSSLVFTIGYFFRDLDFIELFLFTIASLVSAIPEGLPAVLTIVLAVGSSRMAKRKAVIRHLPAVETLGVATIIATDKTGTLTQNVLMSQEIVSSDIDLTITGQGYIPEGEFLDYHSKKKINPLEHKTLRKMFSISSLCNNAELVKENDSYGIIGDPTEASLLIMSKKAGIEERNLEKTEKVVDDLSFNSELKFRASLIEFPQRNKREIYSIGAFETILSKSNYLLKNGKVVNLDQKSKKEFITKAETLAKKGFRVLGLAYKPSKTGKKSISPDDVNGMIFVAFVGMKDPPRENVKEAIIKARRAGIRIIMKTGDHKETALAIAEDIGLIEDAEKAKVFTEQELEKMDPLQFKNAVNTCNVFARVTPKMKLRIVKTLQEQGHVVAMTGDGVNDAPALKQADIGVSMGVIGTDVARESSEIVLTDDNFASIVNAIEEGRIVFQNVRQTSFYLVSTNVAEQVTIISTMLLKTPLPLLPIQILYMNLVTDTFNGLALSLEPGHGDALNQPPRNKKERIINKELGPFILIVSGLMAAGTVPLFLYFLDQGIEKAHTVAFASMTLFQVFNMFNMRSLKNSVFKIGLFSNKWISYSFITSTILMLLIIYVPFINTIFGFTPLSLKEISLITVISFSVLIVGELYKLIIHKNH